MKKALYGLLFILTINVINAQEIKHNESGTWISVINKFKITENIYISNLLQWRLVDDMKHTRIFNVQPIVNFKLSNEITAGIGYDYSNYNLAGIILPTLDYENRFNQHITLFSILGNIKMNQRFMFEERFFKKQNGTEVYANRFRYRINLDFNIIKFTNNKYLTGRVSDEIRIRFTEGISDPIFGQNNFAVLTGYSLLKKSNIYIGYGRNYYNGGVSGYWGDNILNVLLNYDFDLTKNKLK
jgi:hypothetical protein